MKMKLNHTLLCATFCAVALMSCEEDKKTATVPQYGEIIMPEKIYTGQYATAKVTYLSEGSYVQHADYFFSLSNGTSGKVRKVLPNGEEPEFRFKAPLNEGNYRLSFKAGFLFYADLPGGSIYAESNSVNTTFRVLRADAIDACWGDTRDHLDKVIDVRDTIISGNMCKLWSGNVSYALEGADADSLYGKRIYKFDGDDKLCEVIEQAEFELKRKSSYKEFEDGTSGLVYDSLYNYKAYPHLMGQLSIVGYEPHGDAILEGEMQSFMPVAEWGAYKTEEEQARLINAFWNGGMERYTQNWMYDDITLCTVKVWCEGDKLIFSRVYSSPSM